MTKEMIEIKINDEFKTQANQLIEKTIEKVFNSNGKILDNDLKKRIRNLVIDQLNVNVTSKLSSKTLWVFTTENSIPVIVEAESQRYKMGGIIQEKNPAKYYSLKNNLWSSSNKRKDETFVSKIEFEKKALKLFLEDVETASFYAAMSYGDDD